MNPVHYSSKTPEWSTPWDLWHKINDELGPFVIDAAATPENAKCDRFYTFEEDGLSRAWYADATSRGGAVWCNPPYGRGIGNWVRKAYEEACKGARVVLLVPARTDTAWFHDYIMPDGSSDEHVLERPYGLTLRRGFYPDRLTIETTFIRRRLKFGNAKTGAPFPSLVVSYNAT